MVVDLPTRATRSEYASLLPFKRRTANPTALTMTIAITRTITLTLKAILKLLSQDMSGLSAKPGLACGGRQRVQAGKREFAAAVPAGLTFRARPDCNSVCAIPLALIFSAVELRISPRTSAAAKNRDGDPGFFNGGSYAGKMRGRSDGTVMTAPLSTATVQGSSVMIRPTATASMRTMRAAHNRAVFWSITAGCRTRRSSDVRASTSSKRRTVTSSACLIRRETTRDRDAAGSESMTKVSGMAGR
jgi:hypothetical protein